jgi:nucleotide-binding universal stress UspA family protein
MHVLVTIDFSAMTSRVVATAARVGALGGVRLHLLHVVPPDPDFVGYEVGPATVRSQVAKEFRAQREQLERLAAELRDRGCDAASHVAQGPTVATVLAEARRLEAAFIVVGSHGHGAVYDLLIGSISEGIVRSATRPVLVVPAHGDA